MAYNPTAATSLSTTPSAPSRLAAEQFAKIDERKRYVVGNAGAHFAPSVTPHPDWLVEALGAKKERDAWLKANTDGLPLRRAQQAASRALAAISKRAVDGELRPAARVDPADHAEAVRAHDAAEEALEAHTRLAAERLRTFDRAVRGKSGDLGAERIREIAAAHANAAQAEIVEHWKAVRRLIEEREHASKVAGHTQPPHGSSMHRADPHRLKMRETLNKAEELALVFPEPLEPVEVAR